MVLSVADTGAGIPPEHLPHVFERFFRVPGRAAASGTGLGLAIVREIVTAHGGSVTCESRPGEGTVFRITLPGLAATFASARRRLRNSSQLNGEDIVMPTDDRPSAVRSISCR